jgi:putative ABC transport system permease protein
MHPPGPGSRYLDQPLSLLYRSGLRRRSASLVDCAVILGLIVALATSVAVFTASYDGAKTADARYTVGSDFRITPSPASERVFRSTDATSFAVDGVSRVVPVIYGVHNVILRSKRTSDPANMAALDPLSYAQVAPFDDAHFSNGSAEKSLRLLADRPDTVLLSAHMASFLKSKVGNSLRVLLARGSAQQIEIEMEIVGLFDRLPGFPEGADALMNIRTHEAMVGTPPAFFLGQTNDPSDAALAQAVSTLNAARGADGDVRIDTRLTALAKDQSSLAALNIGGLLKLDSGYALAMGTATIAIFVFGLMLQRRREYVTLRALGLHPASIRMLISAEAVTAAVAGCAVGLPVGLAMAYFLINVLRPLFVLDPPHLIPFVPLSMVLGSILLSAAVTSLAASSLVNRLRAPELMRDD